MQSLQSEFVLSKQPVVYGNIDKSEQENTNRRDAMTPENLYTTLGVDLGGTKVETAVVDGLGRILASKRLPTEAENGPDGVINKVAEGILQCQEDSGQQASALGIGVAAQVEKETGTVRFAPNLRWRDVPLRARLEAALGVPVFVTNDVNAVAWGEWRHGAGQGADDIVCVYVGTGIGGGVVCGGRILEGHTNTAGELGHVTIVVNGRPCTCGGRGCLEAYAGGWAIAERAQEAAREEPEKAKTLVGIAGSAERITAAVVSEAFQKKDPLSRRLIEETAVYLSAGLVSFVNAFNPGRLILGGGVIDGLPHLVESVEETVREYALDAATRDLRIVRASLGHRAGVVGAAAFARESLGASKGESGSQ